MASNFHGFLWILEAKLSQVGMENQAKIDQKVSRKYDEQKEGILEASWRRLGTSWTPKNPRTSLDALHARAVAGTQRPLLRIP